MPLMQKAGCSAWAYVGLSELTHPNPLSSAPGSAALPLRRAPLLNLCPEPVILVPVLRQWLQWLLVILVICGVCLCPATPRTRHMPLALRPVRNLSFFLSFTCHPSPIHHGQPQLRHGIFGQNCATPLQAESAQAHTQALRGEGPRSAPHRQLQPPVQQCKGACHCAGVGGGPGV
jgi:hypothetical protein